MKTLAKTLLVQGVRALPLRARRIILDDLARNIGDFKAAGNIAKRVGVTGFVAEGDAGAIRGALDDDAALAKYARDGVWSPREDPHCSGTCSPSTAERISISEPTSA